MEPPIRSGVLKLAGLELPRVLSDALADCRRHFAAAAVFSLLINILYLAPTIYMLQVYDRVVPTAGKTTLLFVTLALALSLLALSGLDMVRQRLLVRASERVRSEEHTSELQSHVNLVCRLLLEKKKKTKQ